MNEALKNQWVATLRSGKYPQGHSALANAGDNTHCCLGVFCEIAPGVDKDENSTTGDYIFQYKTSSDLFYLPKDLASEYFEGLTNPVIELWGDLRFLNQSQSTTLAQLNDDGFTFKQIADVIDYFL